LGERKSFLTAKKIIEIILSLNKIPTPHMINDGGKGPNDSDIPQHGGSGAKSRWIKQ
jgi:hypothetical protein